MTATFADHLRALPDEALAALLRLRPDLVVPPPSDLSALASRAQSRISVARALDGLDQFVLQVLDAARVTRNDDGLTSAEAILALATPPGLAGAERDTVRQAARQAVDRLRAYFLLWGLPEAMHIAAGVDEVCSPYPAGLGRPAADLDPAVATLCADPARLRRTLLSAPPPARAVLDRLAAGPPVGTVSASGGEGDGPGTPVHWLVRQRLLAPVALSNAGANGLPAARPGAAEDPMGGFDAVELPREVALVLRRDTGPLGPVGHEPPTPTATHRDRAAADSAGAGQAMEAVRHTEALLEALGADPPLLLRTGGLGVRELRRVAKAAALTEPVAGLLLEVAAGAGLVGELEPNGRVGTDPARNAQLLPTVGYDAWRAAPLARRWVQLARAWLTLTRQPGVIGRRDERDKPINALSPEVERAGAPGNRRLALEALGGLTPGAAPSPEELLALLAWRSPRRTKGREPLLTEALGEAATLGVSGLGALTSYGRVLLAEVAGESRADEDPLGVRPGAEAELGDSPAAVALDKLLPAPVDHLLVQADLTVVVPGPPEPTLATELEMVADHESGGGATVYRVTPGSVRRALDAGYVAGDLHALFRRRSRTPVPQALTYLVDDVARRHGGLRAGAAGAYLRSDDEALLAELVADRRLTGLGLRRLAPTVLVGPYQVGRLVSALREAGYAPVPEDATGAALLSRPRARRAPARPRRSTPDAIAAARLNEPRLRGLVEQIRRGDAVARAARRAPVTLRSGAAGDAAAQAHTQALAVLQQALRDKALVWVGYVDAHGSSASRLVRPVSMSAGYLRAEDERTEVLHTFALHRITGAALDEG